MMVMGDLVLLETEITNRSSDILSFFESWPGADSGTIAVPHI